jgi:hypothetical protein
VAFEKEVRSGGSASLVEHVKGLLLLLLLFPFPPKTTRKKKKKKNQQTGNSFKVRVYPIHPNQSKQVWLKFTSELAVDGEHLQYNFPINVKDPVNLAVTIAGEKETK